MNYEGTDLGYELGYETDEVRTTAKTTYQLQSFQQAKQTYSMGPGAVPVTGGAPKVVPMGTPDKTEDTKGKDETKDAKVPTYRPDSKAELSKMERNRKADMPFFFESAKDLNTDLTPTQTQDAQHLKKQGIEDKYVQKAYLGLIDKKALERGAKAGGAKFEEMDSKQLHEEAARNLVRKTSDELKSKGYSDDAVKEYLLANGMIESTSTIPPRDKFDIHLPKKSDGSGEIDYAKLGPYDVARHYNKLGSLGEGAPHDKPKWGRLSTAKQKENDAHLSSQSKFTAAREKWLAQASLPKDQGGLGSRADAEKVLSQMGLMGNVKDPEVAAAKLFKPNTQGEPILSTHDGVTKVNGEARLPGKTISAAEYNKKSPEEKAKFDKENPVAAGVIKSQSHGDLQSKYTASLTGKPPQGLGIHPHEAKGILSSKFAGDPPLFDTNGKLKTAAEMGLSQEAYDQRLAQLDGKITEAKKEVLGKAFVLDKDGNPETITKENDDGTTTTIYKMKSEDPADQQKDMDRLLKARSDWRDDRKAEARDYHRERAVEQLRKIGVDEKNMEMLLHGRNLLSDEADPTEIAKFADELEAVDPKNRGDKKKELLKEVKDKDYNAPEDNSPEGQNFAKFKTGKDAQKQGNAQRGGGKSDEAQRNRDHQTAERKAQETFTLKRDETAHKRQMEMKEYDKQMQVELQQLQHENQIKMADHQAEIQKERDKTQFGMQLVQSSVQNLQQLASQYATMPMQNAFQTGQAIMQGTYQMIAASQPRPFDLVVSMLGGAPRR